MVTFPAMQPSFSILIPARNRPDTLRHTLATVMEQPGDDYEVVVADNAGSPEVAQVVAQFASPKLRHSRSDEVLPMAANWERGLALCGGDYVTVVGDDDALVPSALVAMRRLVAATQADLITWRAHVYWWPDTIVPWNRNRLYLNLGGGAKLAKSRSVLEQFYRGALGFEVVPTIYTSFFRRSLIDEARRRHGGFFVPTDTAPDVASGILGLYLTERYAMSGRPLCIRGNSLRSNGTAQWARSLGAAQREIYFREERVGLQGFIHQDLVPSPNLSIIIASAKMKCRDRYFPNDAALQVDLPGLVRELVDNLNREPDAYDDNLRDARALAEKIGMPLDPASIPAPDRRAPSSSWGPIPNEDGQVDRLCVNGDLAGVQDISAAARLSEALMPPIDTFLASDSTAPRKEPEKEPQRPAKRSLLSSLFGKPPP